MHPRRRRPERFGDGASVALRDGCRARRLLDEIGGRGPAAERLEAEGTGTGEEVEHDCAADGVRRLE